MLITVSEIIYILNIAIIFREVIISNTFLFWICWMVVVAHKTSFSKIEKRRQQISYH